MDAVFRYQIPEWHPLAVHFPIALLLSAALAACLWMAWRKPFWHRAMGLLLVLGTMGAFFAYFTGESMGEASEGIPIVDELGRLHGDVGRYTLIAACLSTITLGAWTWWSRRHGLDVSQAPQRFVIGFLVVVTAALVAWAGHVGATMVWGVVG